MDATTISAALDAAELALSQGDSHAARQHIAAARAADAGISDQALEAEHQAWCRQCGRRPGDIATANFADWARHLLSGVRHAT